MSTINDFNGETFRDRIIRDVYVEIVSGGRVRVHHEFVKGFDELTHRGKRMARAVASASGHLAKFTKHFPARELDDVVSLLRYIFVYQPSKFDFLNMVQDSLVYRSLPEYMSDRDVYLTRLMIDRCMTTLWSAFSENEWPK